MNIILSHHTQRGQTALMRATRCDCRANVVELIKAGANLNLQDKVHDVFIHIELKSTYNQLFDRMGILLLSQLHNVIIAS